MMKRLLGVGCALVLSCVALAGGIAALTARSRDPEPVTDLLRLVDPDHPCGPVVVATASHLLGRPIGLDDARLGLRLDPYGRTSLKNMESFFRARGFGAVGFRLSRESLQDLGPSSVAILYVNASHYIVVRAVEAENFLVFDPPRRPLVCSSAKIPYNWEGETLVVLDSASEMESILARFGMAR